MVLFLTMISPVTTLSLMIFTRSSVIGTLFQLVVYDYQNKYVLPIFLL